ncbi:MAG: response regulator transcription factor [Bacteroidales bacterium]|nr:response regulator transcription factor [Bacteroidales bacterium]
MKILIIEDEELAAVRMKQLLEELEPGCELAGPFDTVISSIAHLKEVRDYDLIFLDIQLADGKSFAIFDAIQVDTPVIFTTAFDEYALQAFDLNSIDYLLKPINKDKLKLSLEKFRKMKSYFGAGTGIGGPNKKLYEMIDSLKEKQSVQYKDRFLVNKGDSLVPVKINEIACFYAEDKVVFLLTIDKRRFIIPQTLEELESRLDPHLFFRVNRQFILSGEAIQKVHNYFNFKLKVELVPDPGIEIIVSRSRGADFKAWMNGE